MTSAFAGPMAAPGTPAVLADRYELGELLGRGGMGEVWAARDRRLDREVAVKILRPDMAVQPSIRMRFESEARSAARLSHPNVVSVFDTGEHQGIPFIVMERLSGSTLHDALGHAPLPVTFVRAVAIDVLAALGAAHSAGIVHRDVKPGNVLASASSGWKVADFGIAKSLERVDAGGSEAPDLTLAGQVIGTPAYLSPERIRGGEATASADLYALGVVLYEALVGRRPFASDGLDGWESLASRSEPPPLRQARPEVDLALASAVDRSLQPEPDARFRSAVEMSRAIAGFGAPLVDLPPTAVAYSSPPATEVLPPRRRGSRRLILIPLLIAIAVASLAAALAGPSHKPRPAKLQTPTTVAAQPSFTAKTPPPTTAPAPPAGHHGHGDNGPKGLGGGETAAADSRLA
jgi:serine/threonine protein kinase